MHGERSCLTDFGKSQFCLACTYFQGRPGCPVIGCTVDLPKESCLNYLVIGGGGDTNFLYHLIKTFSSPLCDII